jgi:hypothetical protein
MKAALVVIYLLSATGSLVGLAMTVVVLGELLDWWDLL